jgi:hypothetical protein
VSFVFRWHYCIAFVSTLILTNVPHCTEMIGSSFPRRLLYRRQHPVDRGPIPSSSTAQLLFPASRKASAPPSGGFLEFATLPPAGLKAGFPAAGWSGRIQEPLWRSACAKDFGLELDHAVGLSKSSILARGGLQAWASK